MVFGWGSLWQLIDRTSEGARSSMSWGLLVRLRRSVDRSLVLWLWWQWKVLPILSWVCAGLFHLGLCGGPCLQCWKTLSGCCDRDIFACFEGIGWIVAMCCISSHRLSPVPVGGFHRLQLSHTSLVEVTSTWCLPAILLLSHILGRKVFDQWPF
jgi:hypothetical protein